MRTIYCIDATRNPLSRELDLLIRKPVWLRNRPKEQAGKAPRTPSLVSSNESAAKHLQSHEDALIRVLFRGVGCSAPDSSTVNPAPTMRPRLLSVRKPRSRAKEGPAFVFVDHASSPSSESGDTDARIRIRRQAARSGCKRRREYASHGNTPARDAVTQGRTAEDDDKWNLKMQVEVLNPSPTPPPSYNGYETLRVMYNFDINDLTSFTDVDLGRIAYSSLRDQPTRLASLLQKRSSSFLAFLPSRYGSSSYLDDAMHCVAARAGQMLGCPVRASTPSMLYARALRSLQNAILDRKQVLGPDVYCATRLLALYEVSPYPLPGR